MTELCKIAQKYPTDKFGHHNFTPIYEHYMAPKRNVHIKLLELGIGGYNHQDRGGGCLRMFKEYFADSYIMGVDIYRKEFLHAYGVHTLVLDQTDPDLVTIAGQREFDYIIDDCSHNNLLTVKSFELLFPHLAKGGVYFVEDVHTSYWDSDEYQGDCSGDPYALTTMNFFKRLTDVVNWEHIAKRENYGGLEKYVGMIEHIAFFKEMIVIKKL